MTQEVFRLPDVGEGLTEAEIVTWHVQVGDDVVVNQIIASIETAKAIVELPCPFAGRVHSLHVEQGALVPVGTPILTVEVTQVESAESGAVLVGYGVNNGEGATRIRRPRAESSVSKAVTDSNGGTSIIRAKPLVRRMARELGIDLHDIVPSGRHGEVTREDVLGAVQQAEAVGVASSQALSAERIPVRGVQRAMADAMVASAFSAPQVTVWRDVEVSRFVEVLATMRDHPNFADVRVTPLVLVAAGLIRVIRQFPKMNARWVEEGGQDGGGQNLTSAGDIAHMQLHGHVNLGIAVDTERGLLVPNLKDAELLSLRELAKGLQDLIATARDGRSSPQDLTGGTVTITNIGIFDVDGGTPILNPGESMIVATGRISDRPWVVDGAVLVRPVMTLSMSFDHRLVDGSQASRALSALATFLHDPALALMLE